MLPRLQEISDWANNARLEPYFLIKRSKEYLKRIDLLSNHDIASLSLDLVLDDFFVSTAETYLNELPLLTDLTILVSESTDENFTGSQLFHLDFDDSMNLKLFIPLGSVTERSGPLQAIPKLASACTRETYSYKCGAISTCGIPSHSDTWRDLSGSAPVSFTGDLGSFVLIDTCNCSHRGSRKAEEGRVMLYAQFNTRSSFRYPPLNRVFDLDRLIDFSSPLYRKSFSLLTKEKYKYLLNK